MIRGRQILYLFIVIAVALAAYLYDVDGERKKSVAKYFSSPRVGDVYKIKMDDEEGDSWVHHLKVKEVNDSGLVFMASRMSTNASSDILLNHYNKESSVMYTYRQLQEIKDGKWKNWQKGNIWLMEIKRK